MRLIIKQRIFSWFDSYDIYDDKGEVCFTVKGKLSWGHKFIIYDRNKREVGCIKEQVLRFLPHFEIYENGNYIGEIVKAFTFFKPKYTFDVSGWKIVGGYLEHDYRITSGNELIAIISKKYFSFSDTYTIDVPESKNILRALMVVLAIDAANCSNGN